MALLHGCMGGVGCDDVVGSVLNVFWSGSVALQSSDNFLLLFKIVTSLSFYFQTKLNLALPLLDIFAFIL